MFYEKGLKKLQLNFLEQRRYRGDLKEICKITNSLENTNLIKGLNPVESDYFTRVNSLKLSRELVKNCSSRFNFIEFKINGMICQMKLLDQKT
jgi:hypothetical protein